MKHLWIPTGHRTASLWRAFVTVIAALLISAPLGNVPTVTAQPSPNGVQFLTGTLETDNPIVMNVWSQTYFMLYDMTPYVFRDKTMPIPIESQIMAPSIGDISEGEVDLYLSLPAVPLGTSHDLDGDDSENSGVQLFSVELGVNTFGDPFLSPEEGTGWGQAFSSLAVTSPEGEVIGGQVMLWSPDDEQSFSSGLGDDGIFLTDDDPFAPVEAGWTLIDLNEDPFAFIRDETVEIIFNPGDDGFTDLSDRSFTEAFEALVDELEVRYAFTEEKNIDWDELRATYLPIIEEAEADDDLLAFNNAITEFILEFPDGHVGGTIAPEYIEERIGGRLGMRLAETDDGEVIVLAVTQGLPADEAGIEVGATILEWNGEDPTEAVENAPNILAHSTEHQRRLFLYEMMSRGPLGETVEVVFRNEDGDEETVELEFSEDIENRDARINAEFNFETYDPLQLPVDVSILPTGIGLIRINTFYADPIMMTSAWDTAINTLNSFGIPGLIIDVRDNGGGFGSIAQYMAGSFYDEPFVLFESEMFNEDGEAIQTGFDIVHPVAPRYEFPIALVIDESCASACEIFASAIAYNPDNLIVGYTPTAGVEAGVFTWLLPGGITFQASIVRVTIDGEVAVEGVGVPPTVTVPSTRENLLNPEDELIEITQAELIPAIIDFLNSLPDEPEPEPDTAEDGTDEDEQEDDFPGETERP
jgi:C-terminal processing protease CtpA/Prc